MKLANVIAVALSIAAGACGGNHADVPPDLLDAIRNGNGSTTYPEGPYGTSTGDTVPDLCFDGWSNPSANGYRAEPFERLCLRDVHADSSARLLLVNSSALWCVACKFEYGGSADRPGLGARLAERRPRGFRLLGTLFEAGAGKPASLADAATWASTYDVDFPFVVDGSYEFGTPDVAPVNRVIDTRTMKVVLELTGDEPLVLFSFVDEFLATP